MENFNPPTNEPAESKTVPGSGELPNLFLPINYVIENKHLLSIKTDGDIEYTPVSSIQSWIKRAEEGESRASVNLAVGFNRVEELNAQLSAEKARVSELEKENAKLREYKFMYEGCSK